MNQFSNKSVLLTHLPKIEEVHTLPISRKFMPCNIALMLFIALFFSAVVAFIRFGPFIEKTLNVIQITSILFLMIGIGAVWSITYHLLADKRIRYALREQDILLTKGLIFRSLICQPILRLQHVEIKQGPLARLAGLSSLYVYSAGGAMHTFHIPGLEAQTAEHIRQFILSHKELNAK